MTLESLAIDNGLMLLESWGTHPIINPHIKKSSDGQWIGDGPQPGLEAAC